MRATHQLPAKVWRNVGIIVVAALACVPTCLAVSTPADAAEGPAVYLSDSALRPMLKPQQQWGVFGHDTAAAASTGQLGQPLKVGEQIFAHGLGHHAAGEICVALDGQFAEFAAHVGVQWQGGQRGSVIFRVDVDGKQVFESPRMSDSDTPLEVRIPVLGAREMRLIASDAGDGISCDMANWLEARLLRRPGVPCFGSIATTLAGQAATPSSGVGGQFLLTNGAGPQVAVLSPLGLVTVAIAESEEVRFELPLSGATTPLRVLVEAQGAERDERKWPFRWALACPAKNSCQTSGRKSVWMFRQRKRPVRWLCARVVLRVRRALRGVVGAAWWTVRRWRFP